MVSLYEKLVYDGVFEIDQALLESMRAAIEAELKKLDEKYPTDTDKLMLAKQTGLSRNQVIDENLATQQTVSRMNIFLMQMQPSAVHPLMTDLVFVDAQVQSSMGAVAAPHPGQEFGISQTGTKSTDQPV